MGSGLEGEQPWQGAAGGVRVRTVVRIKMNLKKVKKKESKKNKGMKEEIKENKERKKKRNTENQLFIGLI